MSQSAHPRTNERIAWFNGKWVPEREVMIPFRDRSWLYGDGAFDMTRTFDGRIFRIKEHIDRFYRSLNYLRIDPGMQASEMVALSEEIVERNAHLRAEGGDWWVGQRVSRAIKKRIKNKYLLRSEVVFLELHLFNWLGEKRVAKDILDVLIDELAVVLDSIILILVRGL